MLLRVFLCVCSFVFLKLCGATDIPCTVTQDGERTVYSLPEFIETDCVYAWLNKTGHVLANDEEPTVGRTVVSHTNRTLVTNECSKQIIHRRTCFPEWVQHTATCTSNCSRTSAAPNGSEFASWIVPFAISVVLVLVLVLLVLVLVHKFRGHIPSRCRNLCCRYAPVKTQDTVTQDTVTQDTVTVTV
ncbi:hypothetical protein VZT92_001271 [Zoarces viviparus]|uniref:Uncharacterized protein n=1 Tax=Zoarces viviparus TaxID=48416 RepID=A0AAW1G3E5_ZOAVI